MKYLALTIVAIIAVSCAQDPTEKLLDEMLEGNLSDFEYVPPAQDFTELAEYCAQETVTKNLKSPTTAEYNTAASILKINDTVYKVIGSVDAQNEFGAMIRGEYSCVITFTDDGDSYTSSDITIQ